MDRLFFSSGALPVDSATENRNPRSSFLLLGQKTKIIMNTSNEKSKKSYILIFFAINAIYCYIELLAYLLQLFYLDVSYLNVKMKRDYKNEIKGLIQ